MAELRVGLNLLPFLLTDKITGLKISSSKNSAGILVTLPSAVAPGLYLSAVVLSTAL